MTSNTVPDMRGHILRSKRLMPDSEAREFLSRQRIAHVGTVDGNGWPYVVPLVYIYEGGDSLYLHTGSHQGHFLTNLQQNSRICVEVSDIGPLHNGKRFACDSALVYTSVVVFGTGTHSLSRSRKRKHGFWIDFSRNTGIRRGNLNRDIR